LLQRLKGLVVLFKHGEDIFYPKNRTKCLVLSNETNPYESIPFLRIHLGTWFPRLNSNNRGIHLGRRPEIVLPNFEKMGDSSIELGINRKTTV
jgi:hypothetical protein